MGNSKKAVTKGAALLLGDYIIIVPTLILIVLWTAIAPNFMTYSNWMNLLRQVSMIAIMASGMLWPMLTGCTDLGMGSVVGLTGIIFAKAIVDYSMNPILAAVIAVLVGIICGLTSGTVTTRLGVPAFIATLGVQFVGRGLCYVITNSYPVSGLPESIAWVGRGYLTVGGVELIPWPVIFMFIAFIAVTFVANKTKFGRYVYAVGGNEEAAYLSGINAKVIRTAVFVISGAVAGLVSVILVSRLNSGQPQGGLGWEFKAVISCVIGGISMKGGKGKPVGVALGALFVGILENGMTLLNISSYHQQCVQGIVLILAVAFDAYKSKRQAESK